MTNSVYKIHLNRLRDGRGQGRGADYIPFIQANDNKVASEGWLTRTQAGIQTGYIIRCINMGISIC